MSTTDWQRASRRDGYGDGKNGRPATQADEFYQRGYREGAQRRRQIENRALIDKLPEVDFDEGEWGIDYDRLAEWVRKVLELDREGVLTGS